MINNINLTGVFEIWDEMITSNSVKILKNFLLIFIIVRTSWKSYDSYSKNIQVSYNQQFK
jgi:hypothetical protein